MNFITKLWLRLEWQQKHYQPTIVKSDEEHVCAFCGEHYTGNFCPQCGLEFGRERFTWRTMLLNLMDLWGVGRRNVFLTIGHLLWRPGYLMYDYLRAKHRAYFPPVPLLVAICLLFTLLVHTFDINWDQDLDLDIQDTIENSQNTTYDEEVTDREVKEKMEKQLISIEKMLKAEKEWSRDHLEYSLIISTFLFILLASWIFYQSPRIKLTIVESFYVQTYIACQMMIVAIPYTLIRGEICASGTLPYPLPSLLSFAILVVDYHQLCGYSIWGTIWRLFLMIGTYLLFGTIIGIIFTVLYLVIPIIFT